MMANKAQTYAKHQQLSMDELVDQHAGLVQRIAYHLSARLPPSVVVDDLIQAGMIGLLDAAQHYDASQGASFETYASIRIRGAMLDELRRNDWAPKSVHRKARDMLAAVNKIEGRTGRDAKPHEVAEVLGITTEEYHQLVWETNTCRLLNFAEVEYDERSFSDGVADHREAGPLGGIEKSELRQYLAKAITALPEREQLIVSLYYDEELNLKEIGCVLGVSESRISQLLSQAHLRMRAGLAEYLAVEAE
jgi:RNA polymerase sigma factor for flagellar operon FliA